MIQMVKGWVGFAQSGQCLSAGGPNWPRVAQNDTQNWSPCTPQRRKSNMMQTPHLSFPAQQNFGRMTGTRIFRQYQPKINCWECAETQNFCKNVHFGGSFFLFEKYAQLIYPPQIEYGGGGLFFL